MQACVEEASGQLPHMNDKGGDKFFMHTEPKANTNKNTNKQIYVVPQNRVRPRRQQIVYYWRNDTNTQLNPVQSYKTQCFTLTLSVSLKSTIFHSHSCTCTHCILTLFY
jgi:hypothetical protein